MKRLALFLALLAGSCAAAPLAAVAIPTSPPTTPPDMMFTGVADQITDTSARVVGYGHSAADACWFDYGPTTAYGKRADVTCSGTTYGQLNYLIPGTLYHYRFAGSNAAGTGYGVDKTFTTTGTAPPPPGNGTPTPAAATVEVVAHQTLPGVLSRGLRLRAVLSGSCPCKIRAELLVSRSIARRLGIAGSSANQVIGRTSRSNASGTLNLTIRPGAAARKKLRQARRLTAVSRVTVTGSSGQSKVVKRTLHLKRR
jgi:hypothetical protein